MENALKGLLLAAATIITCTIIAFGFRVAKLSKSKAAETQEALNTYENRLTENNYLVYDGRTISGSELVNLLRYEYSRPGDGTIAYFEIITGNRNIIKSSSGLKDLTNKNSAYYVSPQNAFVGEAIWENGCLIALRFRQK